MFIVYCVYISLGQPTVKVNYIEEMTRVTRPVADESLNAANLYNKAIAIYVEEPNVVGEDGVEQKLYGVISKKHNIKELTEAELAGLELWISSNSEVIKLYKQGSERPYCWWERDSAGNMMSVLVPELRPMRNITKLMGWKAKYDISQGKSEDAFNGILAMYRVGEHFKGPRILIEQLVGNAIQALAVQNAFTIISENQFDENMLKKFQNSLEVLVEDGIFVTNFKCERFFFLDFIQQCYTDNVRGSGRMSPQGLKKYMGGWDEWAWDGLFCLAASLVTIDREQMTEIVTDYYDEFDEMSRLTPYEINQKGIDYDQELMQWSRFKRLRYWPIDMLLPALTTAAQFPYRTEIHSKSLILVLALQRYKLINNEYPDDLHELVKSGLIESVPLDPFSNGIISYRKTPDSFILYSFGRNFKDDGGVAGKGSSGKKNIWADDGDAVFWPMYE